MRRFTKGRFKILLIVLVALFIFNADNISNFHTVASFDGDSRIVELASEAGLNNRGKALFLSQSPELVSADKLHSACPRDYIVFGCYLPGENKIYILEIPTDPYSQSVPSTIAHEMLHVAWEELSADKRDEIKLAIKDHMSGRSDTATKSIKTTLKGYDDDTDLQADEAHAFIGSEVYESQTSDVLNSHYNKYFVSRDKSAQANSSYVVGVENISEDLVYRRKALETKLQEIHAYKAKWLTPFDSVLQTALYYGDYYSYNDNVNRYNGNLENYNRMIEEYETDRREFNADINSFNNAMAAMEPNRRIDDIKTTVQ